MDAISIAKTILNIVKQIYDQVQLAKANQGQCKGLENRIRLIVSAIPKLDQLPNDEAYCQSLWALQEKLTECLNFIKQFSDTKWYLRILKAGDHQAQFIVLHQGLHQAIQQLNLGLSSQQILNCAEDRTQQQQDAEFIKKNQGKIIELCTEGLVAAKELKEHQKNILAPQISSIRVQMKEVLALLGKAEAKQVAQSELIIDPRYHIPLYELEFKKTVGEGAFSSVFEGRWDKHVVAIKLLKGRLTSDDQKLFISEIRILSRLNHPCIPRFFGANRDNDQGCFVMEYFPLGSLYTYLQQHQLTEPEKVNLAFHLASGLNYLHRKDVIHLDFKSQNVLLSQENSTLIPKIIDFGLARLSTGSIASLKKVNRAWAWSAPEIRNQQSILTVAADVYSFGTVLWEIMTGRHPFAALGERELLQKLIKGETESVAGIASFYAEMIQNCWQSDPLKRPTMQSIVAQLEIQKIAYQRPLLSLPVSPMAAPGPSQELLDVKHSESQGVRSEKLKDYKSARSFYEVAIVQGSVRAKTNLADLLLKGRGGEKDKPRAAILLRESAKAGHVRAMHNLALMLKIGDGIEADAKAALSLFGAAAERDHPESMYLLATMLENGEGAAKNLEQAQRWYEKAEKAGYQKSGYQSQREHTQVLTFGQASAGLLTKNVVGKRNIPVSVDPQRVQLFNQF